MSLSQEDKELLDSVIATVMARTGVSYEDLVHGRTRGAVSSRRATSLILRDHDWSYPKIAEGLEKDHASIYSLVNRASENVIREAKNLKKRILHGEKPVYQLVPDLDWQKDAVCKDTPTEVFFDVKYKKRALALCSKCPVQVECLDYRFQTLNAPDEDSGIWGNTTPAERARMSN